MHGHGLISRLGRQSVLAGLVLPVLWCAPALALSEIPREEPPAPIEEGPTRRPLPPVIPQTPPATEDTGTPSDTAAPESRPGGSVRVPLPDPIVVPRDPEPDDADTPATEADDDVPVPEVQYDPAALPEPVRRLRERIMEVALTGDLEALRPLMETGDAPTQLSFGGSAEDPIEFLRSISGDGQGQEILAILYEVLAAGYVHLDPGTPNEIYVWPYFFAVPLQGLDARQRVELFKLVTAGDYEEMKNFGAYIFYRAGISPEGRWLFFVAGD